MSVVAVLEMRARLADPKPHCCCVCMAGADADTDFVDFQSAHDGVVLDPISGGVIARLSKVQICRACVEQAAEVLEFRPTLHRRHLEAVREAYRERDEFRTRYEHLSQYVVPENVQALMAEVEELRAFKAEHDQSLEAQEAS